MELSARHEISNLIFSEKNIECLLHVVLNETSRATIFTQCLHGQDLSKWCSNCVDPIQMLQSMV